MKICVSVFLWPLVWFLLGIDRLFAFFVLHQTFITVMDHILSTNRTTAWQNQSTSVSPLLPFKVNHLLLAESVHLSKSCLNLQC